MSSKSVKPDKLLAVQQDVKEVQVRTNKISLGLESHKRNVRKQHLEQKRLEMKGWCVVSGSSVPAKMKGEKITPLVTMLIQKAFNVNVPFSEIQDAYRLGTNRRIMVKFTSVNDVSPYFSLNSRNCPTLEIRRYLTKYDSDLWRVLNKARNAKLIVGHRINREHLNTIKVAQDSAEWVVIRTLHDIVGCFPDPSPEYTSMVNIMKADNPDYVIENNAMDTS